MGGMIPKVLDVYTPWRQESAGPTSSTEGYSHCILLEIFTNKGIGTMITRQLIPYYENEKLDSMFTIPHTLAYNTQYDTTFN